MNAKKWGVGSIIWFVLMILGQWPLFTNEITKAMPSRQAEMVYLIAGLIGTALYLWLAIGKKKAAMITIIVLGVINTLSSLVQGGGSSSFLSLVAPAITYLIAH